MFLFGNFHWRSPRDSLTSSEKFNRQPGIKIDTGFLRLNVELVAIMVPIVVNGELKSIESDATVSELLKSLKMNPRFLAVELNRRVVPREEHDRVRLKANDELEIVTLVGGG